MEKNKIDLKISLKDFDLDDFNFVFDVKKIVYKKYVEEFYDSWDESFQLELFQKFIDTEKNNIKIIICNNEKIGFINGKTLSDNSFEQGNICLLPEWQRKGIGTKLLKNVIRQHSGQDIFLRVFKTNPARKLYERLGFVTFNETKSHFLMKRASTKN